MEFADRHLLASNGKDSSLPNKSEEVTGNGSRQEEGFSIMRSVSDKTGSETGNTAPLTGIFSIARSVFDETERETGNYVLFSGELPITRDRHLIPTFFFNFD